MRRKQFNVRLDPELVERLREINKDPVTGKTRYGSLSDSIEAALWKYVSEHSKKDVK